MMAYDYREYEFYNADTVVGVLVTRVLYCFVVAFCCRSNGRAYLCIAAHC